METKNPAGRAPCDLQLFGVMPSYDELVLRLRAAGCVYAEDEARLLIEDGRDLEELVARRVEGEPLEQVLGWVNFDGIRVLLRPGVFVPRQRTVFLARQAGTRLPGTGVAVDLCCGSGAIAAWLEDRAPRATVYATDIDPVAVACALDNLRGTVVAGDLFDGLPSELRGQVDVLVANTPYVPSDRVGFLPPEARDHEPLHTLDGGPDGLALLRRISAEETGWLRPGGHLLIEISEPQRDGAAAAFVAGGLEPSFVQADDGTVVAIGQRPGGLPPPP